MDTLRLVIIVAFGFFHILSHPWQYIPLFSEFVYQRTLQRVLLQPMDEHKHYYKNIISGTIHYDVTTCSPFGCPKATEFEKLIGADPKTFQILHEQFPEYPQYPETLSRYAKDKNHVYDQYGTIRLADPKTFTLIRSSLGKDRHRYYFMNQPLVEILHKQFPENNPITQDDLEVLSFSNNTFVIKQNNKYFRFKIFDTYTPIQEVAQSQANTYPPLTSP